MYVNGILINKESNKSFDKFNCPGSLKLANDGNTSPLNGIV